MGKNGRRQVAPARPQVQSPPAGDVLPAMTTREVLPRSVRSLPEGARETFGVLRVAVAQLQDLEDHRDELVARLRSQGVSWSAIGWAVGTSGEAARKRWGR